MSEPHPMFDDMLNNFGEALMVSVDAHKNFVCEHERVVSEIFDVPTGGGLHEPTLKPTRFFKCLDCETEWQD